MTKNTVAIIEDDVALAGALTQGLTKEGFDVSVARNGEEGLTLIESMNPDIVLLDISMPKMDGIEMLRELRKREGKDAHTRILILTNLDDLNYIAEATELGALGYLQKSEWHIEDIIQRIRSTLEAPPQAAK